MNCDQVFDALTRGPFPTGNDAHDERVERHLGRCGSCRRLASALQPAVELFEEAVSPEESCGLPAYWGELFSQGDGQPATRTRAPRLLRRAASTQHRHQPTRFRLEHVWRIAAALLLGMAIGGVLRAALREPAQHNQLVASGDRGRLERVWKFDALGMTAACGPLASLGGAKSGSRALESGVAIGDDDDGRSGPKISAARNANSLAALALAQQKCCTECHHSGSAIAVAQAPRNRIASSCEVCHVGEQAISLGPTGGGGD